MMLPVGARLGPYVIDGRLGAGGMGEVYRARDTRLDRLVAIKILPREVTADADARARFDREARTVSALDHPNICTLYDVGEVEGAPFLVMQYLDGRTIAEDVRSGPLPVQEVRRIGLELASALQYAHDRHILHRDIKPQNIMLLADGRPKLLDFGIAQRGVAGTETMAETAAALTRAGSVVGTLEYMSPEQLSGAQMDARSDIFSLGIVLYEIATGQHPFGGTTPPLTMSAILTGASRPMIPGSPASALDPVLRKMLARSPEDRYRSLAACIHDLRLVGERAIASPTDRPGAAAATIVPAPAADERDGKARARRARRPMTFGRGVLLIIIAGYAGRSLLTRPWRTAERPSVASDAAATVTRARLTYSLEVEPRAGAPTFLSVGEQLLPRGSRFRMNIDAASGHLYLLDDQAPDPTKRTGLSVLFTGTIDGHVTTDWVHVTGRPGTDRLWILWSAMPIDDVDAMASSVNAGDRGLVRDPIAAERVRRVLSRADVPRATDERRGPDDARATVEGDGTVIAHRLELQHE